MHQEFFDVKSDFFAFSKTFHGPGELGDFADKIQAVGALLGLVIDVDQADIVP